MLEWISQPVAEWTNSIPSSRTTNWVYKWAAVEKAVAAYDATSGFGENCCCCLSSGEEPQESKHGLLTTIGYQLGPQEAPQYALEGSIAIGGAGVSWLRDQMGLIDSAEESETVAASVRDTAGAILVDLLSFPVITSGASSHQMAFTNFMTYVNEATHEHGSACSSSTL